jgi:hypothetical protein
MPTVGPEEEEPTTHQNVETSLENLFDDDDDAEMMLIDDTTHDTDPRTNAMTFLLYCSQSIS